MTTLDLFASPPSAPPARVTCWSMWQPFAGLVAAGLKTLETRLFPWPERARPYPSTLLICATAASDNRARDRFKAQLTAETWALCQHRSVALCLVDVVGCRPLRADDLLASWYWDPVEDAKSHPGKVRHAWELANVRRVKPFAVAGGQGFSKSMPMAEVEQLGGLTAP